MRDLSMLSEPVATVAHLGPPEPEGCSTMPPSLKLWFHWCWSKILRVLCKQLAVFMIQECSGLKADTKLCYLKLNLSIRS